RILVAAAVFLVVAAAGGTFFGKKLFEVNEEKRAALAYASFEKRAYSNAADDFREVGTKFSAVSSRLGEDKSMAGVSDALASASTADSPLAVDDLTRFVVSHKSDKFVKERAGVVGRAADELVRKVVAAEAATPSAETPPRLDAADELLD